MDIYRQIESRRSIIRIIHYSLMNILQKFKTGRFSFGELTSNDTGKTSASGTIGCLICFAGVICFLWGGFTKQSELINQAIAYTAIGTGLLGYRKGKETEHSISIQPDSVLAPEPVADPAPVDAGKPLNS